jgi:hypothetical protein
MEKETKPIIEEYNKPKKPYVPKKKYKKKKSPFLMLVQAVVFIMMLIMLIFGLLPSIIPFFK